MDPMSKGSVHFYSFLSSYFFGLHSFEKCHYIMSLHTQSKNIEIIFHIIIILLVVNKPNRASNGILGIYRVNFLVNFKIVNTVG